MDKIHQLDGLRGWMALWVWFTHGLTMASLPLHKEQGLGRLLANGGVPVGVFILLSGFVVAMVLFRSPGIRYSEWITRRFFRLFPVYLLALALSVLALDISIAALSNNPFPSPRADDRLAYLQASQLDFWPHLVLHIGLLHGLVPESLLPHTSLAFIGQAWSLSLEWQFYLVAPLGWFLLRRWRTHWPAQVVTVALLCMLARWTPQVSFLGSHLFLFAIGTFSFWRMSAWKAGTLSTRTWLITMAVEVGVVLALSGGSKTLAVLLWNLTLLATLQVGGTSRWHVPLNRFLNHPVSQALGRISYSVYCLHMVVLFALSHVLVNVLSLTNHALYSGLVLGLGLPITLILSWWVTRHVEEPMIQLGRRLAAPKRRRPAIATEAP